VADELDHLGRKLRHVAETFEQEDNTAARNLEGMGWVDFTSQPTIPMSIDEAPSSPSTTKKGDEKHLGAKDAWRWTRKQMWNHKDKIWDGFTVAPVIISVAKAGKHVSGVSGPLSLASKHFVRGVKDLDEPLGKSAATVGFAFEFMDEATQNWQDYKGDPSKVILGTAMETGLGVGASLVGGTIGTAAGAALGSLAGPAGTVIGGKIGGVVGAWAGGWAAEKLEDVKVGGRELDQIAVEAVTKGSKAAGEKIGQALSPFVDSVANLF
jgi:hypothetical protein